MTSSGVCQLSHRASLSDGHRKQNVFSDIILPLLPQKDCQDNTSLPEAESLWHQLQPILSPSSSLSYHSWSFCNTRQMTLMLTQPPQLQEKICIRGGAGNSSMDYSDDYWLSAELHLQDSSRWLRGATSAIYRSLSHLVKRDGVLVSQPELPVASPFLGRVIER